MNNIPPFYIGQKVVCVNDAPGWITGVIRLSKGRVYTVLDTVSYSDGSWDVRVEKGEKTWDSSRFAPMEENFEEIAFEEVIEVEKKLTCAN